MQRQTLWGKQIAAHPELFPEGIEAGYRFHGWVKSCHQQNAYRTSNQVDRPMNYLDRTLYAMQDFHGKWGSAEQSSRAMALL